MSALVRVLILTAVDGASAFEADVRARLDQQVVLYAAIEERTKDRCTLMTNAPRVETKCKLIAPPLDATITWSKVEAADKAYNNVPGGKFSLASIAWSESTW